MALIKTEPLTDYYEVKEELGRGRFAVVKRCVKLSTGEVYAAKCIRKARAGRRGREQLLLEIDILHNSNHPKMVKLYDVFETRTEMILILEYAAGGDLHKHCLEVESVRTEKEICSLIYQIVEAALYLHDNHVVHLDLKPENILLKNDDKFPEIRLIDFGLSRRVDLPYSQYDIVGTPEYVAPEVLSYEPIKISADMWSIGVVSYVLLSGISPFAGDDVMETYANIANVDFDFDAEEFDDISDEAKDFIESLLIKDPLERLSTKECLEHPWLKQMARGVQREDIEAALIAEEAFEKLIREESISRLDSEISCFSSETDTHGDGEQAISSDDMSDMLTDDGGDNRDSTVFLEETRASEERPEAEATEAEATANGDVNVAVVMNEQKIFVEDSDKDTESQSNDRCSEVEMLQRREDLLSEDDRLIADSLSSSVETVEPSLPESKPFFAGSFDIDSLISKEDDSVEADAEHIANENSDIPVKENPIQGDINANVETIEPESNVACGVQKSSELDLLEVENQPLNDSDKPSSVRGQNLPETNVTEPLLKVGVDLKKQISSDAVLTSRKTPIHSYVTKGADSKTLLNRAKSADETLLSNKKKISEIGKGNKLGAHLEKLTKAGLHIKEEPNGITSPVVSQNSSRDSPRISRFDKIKGESEKKESPFNPKLSGSTNSTSDRAKLDFSSVCFVDQNTEVAHKMASNSQTPSAKQNGESALAESPTKVQNDSVKLLANEKSTPANTRKISTPSSEKTSYPKKQSLGVPQGIAAQMASKFSSSADKAGTPSPAKASRTSSQSILSSRKYWQGATPESKRAEVEKAKRCSLKMDKTLFSNAVKVAKGEVSQEQTVELEQKSKSPRNSPKVSRSKNLSEMQVKDRAEQYMKAAADSDHRNKTQVYSPQIEKKIMNKANRFEDDSLLEAGVKKENSKENIVQKFEKQKKHDIVSGMNQVNVQPKGLQFSFSLQAGNKFKIKDANVEKDASEAGLGKTVSTTIQDGKKTVTFDTKKEKCPRRKIEPVTIPKSFSGMLEEDDTNEPNGNDHIEHTAIGALATMPRTPLRDLRSKSRTSRDGGSPSSPRKAYRRLYVTHVKGSKSEQESETPDDIADIKTKVEQDELKVELLVKFGTL